MTTFSRLPQPQRADFCLVVLLALSAGIAWMLTRGAFPSGDEAVVGLMALKISQGADFPIFFWGAHYSGPLASYLAAPLHLLLEPSPSVLCVPAVLLHLIYSCGIFLLAGGMFRRQAALAAGLCAALPFDLFPYAALGGYTESLSFTPWLFLLIHGVHPPGDDLPSARAALAGLLSGFVLWVFPIAAPVVLISLVCAWWHYRSKTLAIMLLCTAVGLIPLFVYNLVHPGASFLRLLARPASLDRGTFLKIVSEQGLPSLALHAFENWAMASLTSLRNLPEYTLQLFHITPEASWWELAAGIAALIGFLAACRPRLAARGIPRDFARLLPGLAVCTYAFTVLFGLDRHRYLIPALFLVPFGWALILERLRHFLSRTMLAALIGILLGLHAFSNFWIDGPPQPSCPELIRLLEARGLHRGYANYDIAYPLVYLSGEKLLYTPFFHSPQYDRHAPYTETVNRSERPAFIFSSMRNALLFRSAMDKGMISYKEEDWQGITVFYDIHPRIDIHSLKLNLTAEERAWQR